VGCSSAEPAPSDLPAGLTGEEILDRLDRLGGADRPTDLMASVQAGELVLSDGVDEAAVPLAEEEFYLAFAPFVAQTPDCHFHSLTTCQGELVEEDLEVRIVTDDGEVRVDEDVTTFANGFAGYSLPRDIEATLEVAHDDLIGTIDIATAADSPTCLTTLQLT